MSWAFRVPAVWPAPAPHDAKAGRLGILGGALGEEGLAHARIAAHHEHATPAGRGLDARLAQRVELTPAPDERGSHDVTVPSTRTQSLCPIGQPSSFRVHDPSFRELGADLVRHLP